MRKPRTGTAVQSLILKYEPSYNYDRQYQYQGVRNQLMSAQHFKLGVIKVKQKMISRNSIETLTISPAIIVEKKDTVLVTISSLRRQNSKRM